MGDLLARAGFLVRTATRADCALCTGRSCGTVSYNAEVAHCFPCDWSANRYTLARDLGLRSKVRTGSRAKAWRAKRESQQRAKNVDEIRAFTRWRDERLRQVSDRYYALSRAAVREEQALGIGLLTPEGQSFAWDALARFSQEEARLSAAFDFLMCAKASEWLEEGSRIEDLVEYWRVVQASACGGSCVQGLKPG